MKASAVRLKVRVRLADGSGPFLDPVLSPNGKLKPQYDYVDGGFGTAFLTRHFVISRDLDFPPVPRRPFIRTAHG
jgi:hypothetical protein